MPRVKSKFVEKVWGREEWVVNTRAYCGKILTINPGFQCSLHYHPVKDETFYVLEGYVCLEVGRGHAQFLLYPGEGFRLYPGVRHRFRSVGNRPARVIEFSTHHNDDDVVRLEESREI